MQKTVIVSLALVFGAYSIPAHAQEGESAPSPPHLTVLSFIVPYSKLPAWNAMQDSVFTPVLNGLVDEGYFISWGQMTHNWGDEWNAGTYIISESHTKFLEGWTQYWQRLNAKDPDWFAKSAELFTLHKDNMYTIRYQYDGSGQ